MKENSVLIASSTKSNPMGMVRVGLDSLKGPQQNNKKKIAWALDVLNQSEPFGMGDPRWQHVNRA